MPENPFERLNNFLTDAINSRAPTTHTNIQLGVIGKLDTDGEIVEVSVSGRTGYVWVRTDDNSEPLQVYNQQVSSGLANLPVEIGINRLTGVHEVIRASTDAREVVGAGASHFNQPDRYGELDRTVVIPENLKWLRIKGGTTLTISVTEGFYTNDSNVVTGFTGGTLDLTSQVPSTENKKAPVIIGIDRGTGALTSYKGTEVSAFSLPQTGQKFYKDDVATAFEAAKTSDNGVLWFGCVPLTNGQTLVPDESITLWSLETDRNGLVSSLGDTMTGQLFIDGSADEIQLRVQGNGTQTANLFEIEDSGGTDLVVVDENGVIGIGEQPSVTTVMQTSKTMTGTTTDTLRGIRHNQTFNPSSTPATAYPQMMTFSGSYSSTNSITTGFMVGITSSLSIDNTGVPTNGVRGVDQLISNTSTGTLSNAINFYARSVVNSGGGTITNAYGLYVQDQTAAVNNYAIYTQGGLVRFGDDIEINNAAIRQVLLQNSGNADDYVLLYDSAGGSQGKISKSTSSGVGAAFFDIGALPQDGTSDATIRMFRETNTTGSVRFAILKGDGTANERYIFDDSFVRINHGNESISFQIRGASDNNMFYADGANDRVGIGSTGTASAKLEIASTTGALLIPRMTTTQRNALTAANGMGIYNTTTNQFEKYENGAWVAW